MKRLTTTVRLCIALLLFALLPTTSGSGTLAQQPSPAVTPAAQRSVQSPQTKRQEAFKIVWQTVNDLFYDPKFGGVNWAGVRERYEPLVTEAQSDQELHELLQQMLNELHQSHFMVIPPEAIPKLRLNKPPGDAGAHEHERDEALEEEELLDSLNFKETEKLSTGIGIDLRVLDGSAVVTRVEPGSSAARAGLRPGFVIKKVGGQSLDLVIAQIENHPLWGALIRPELPIFLLAGFINGEQASSVKVGYLDAGNRLRTVNIKREKLKGEMSSAIGNLPSMYLEFELKRLQGGIGYIRFNAFVPPMMEKLCTALRSMKNAPGLILDLRGNHGGLLGMIGGLSGLLETRPTSIGTMETRGGPTPLYAFPQTDSYAGPLVILLDGSTQSAGEIFASGLKDAGRADLVGEHSAGKTLPSAIMKLPTGALFQYGFANYTTPSGKRLEGIGIAPDLPVKLSRKALLRGSDPQLSAAIRRLREQIQINNWIRNPGRPVIVVAKGPPSSPESADVASEEEPPPPRVLPPVMMASEPILGMPSVAAILEKYAEASGGRKAFEKFTSRVSKGTVELTALGVKGTAEFYEQMPGKSSLIINATGLGIMQRTFDGSRGWLQDPLQGYINLTGFALDMAKTAAVFNKQIKLKELYPAAMVVGKEKVDSVDAYVLRLGFEKWFFGVESGLLLRKGNTYYVDYREVDGVKLPFRVREDTFSGVGVLFQLTEIKHNVEIDAAKFTAYPTCFTKS